MAEMDQPRNTQNTASSSSQPPPWGVGGDTYPYDSHAPGSQPQQTSYYNPNPSPPPVAITNRPMSASPVQGYDLSSSVTEGICDLMVIRHEFVTIVNRFSRNPQATLYRSRATY